MSSVCPLCGVCAAIVELAACKHMICSSYFYEYQGRSTSVCPVCTLESAEDHLPANNCSRPDDSTRSSSGVDHIGIRDCRFIVVHGYRNTAETWHSILSKRLEDMRLRYDAYLELFLNSKTLFVHVPKAAGTSLEAALFDIRNRSQHAPLSYWKRRIKQETWDKIFKFAVVRHPFHRLISGYTYWKNGALAGQKVDQPFVHRCRRELDTLPKFVDYLIDVKNRNLWDSRDVQGFDGTCPVQFRPQLWFLSAGVEDISSSDKYDPESEEGRCDRNRSIKVQKNDCNSKFNCSSSAQNCNMSNSSSSRIRGELSDTNSPSPECSEHDSRSSSKSDTLIPINYIGKYERLQEVYSVVTQSINTFNLTGDIETDSHSDNRHGDANLLPPAPILLPSSIQPMGTSQPHVWPALPHKRASLHSRELPECFQDPDFVKAVLTVYQCDFDAFGFSLA